MKAKFILNYPQNERISTFILDFFLAELEYARSADDHELWIVSPWIYDFNFDLSTRGSYDNLWPGYTKSSIPFSSILKKFLDYQSTINIVCRPPHELVPFENFRIFHQTKERMTEIENLFEELLKLEGNIRHLTSSQKGLKESILNLTKELRDACSELRFLLDLFRESARGHSNVISFIQNIKRYEPNKVNIYYNYRLHAKILLGKLGGFFGSANITHSGFNYNDELFAYTAEKEILDALHIIVTNLAQSKEFWWRKKSTAYSILYEYQRQTGNLELIKEIARSDDLPEDLREVFELLGI